MGFKTNQELQSVAIIKLKNTVSVCYITIALSDLPVSAVGLIEVHRTKLIYPVYLYMICFSLPSCTLNLCTQQTLPSGLIDQPIGVSNRNGQQPKVYNS